jgi:hypothetical protein
VATACHCINPGFSSRGWFDVPIENQGIRTDFADSQCFSQLGTQFANTLIVTRTVRADFVNLGRRKLASP